jgi:hypothetical protein
MKPIVYVLELCDTTGEHRPVAVMRASTPFPPVSVGDRFDDEGWTRVESADQPGTREQPRRYVVHSIKHVLIEESERFVARYCLNLTPHGGARSPVWGDGEPDGARREVA